MRKKHLVVLVAVLCFITSFFVLGAKAKSGVRVKRVPKSKLSLFMKAVGNFVYDAKLNRWEMSESYVDSNTKKHPVVLKPVLIGEQKVPAYYEPGVCADIAIHNSTTDHDDAGSVYRSAESKYRRSAVFE